MLLNEETLDWKWVDTLTSTHRKIKKVYPSVKKFLLEVEELEIRAKQYNLFYKIIVQDKKHQLKQLNTNLYKHFAIIEPSITDLVFEKQNNEIAKKVVESLSSKDVSNNLLEFILKNNSRNDLVENIKRTYHSYDVGAINDKN